MHGILMKPFPHQTWNFLSHTHTRRHTQTHTWMDSQCAAILQRAAFLLKRAVISNESVSSPLTVGMTLCTSV